MRKNFHSDLGIIFDKVESRFGKPITTEKVVYGIFNFPCNAKEVVKEMDFNLLKVQSQLLSIIGSHNNNASDGNEYISGNITLVLDKLEQVPTKQDTTEFLKAVFLVDSLSKSVLERNGLTKSKIDKIQSKSVNKIDKESFYYDLTKRAKDGMLDKLIGRSSEIERCIKILSRRRKSNPLLIGEPGVGKTAIVEGLAQKIVNEEVPDNLFNKRILVLEIGKLVAGTKYRGEFEEKLYEFLKHLNSVNDAIVFIDEIHTIMGTGAAEGGIDAGNILKPALSRGDIQFIGATTLEEFHIIKRDKALERRFQVIQINEPSIVEMKIMAPELKIPYERFHNVRFPDKVVNSAIELSDLYIKDRFFPDKLIDILDEVGAANKGSNISIEDVHEVFSLIEEECFSKNNLIELDLSFFQPFDIALNNLFQKIKKDCSDINFYYRSKSSILIKQNSSVITDKIIQELSRFLLMPYIKLDAADLGDDLVSENLINFNTSNKAALIIIENIQENNLSFIDDLIYGRIRKNCEIKNLDISQSVIICSTNDNVESMIFNHTFDLKNISNEEKIDLLINFVKYATLESPLVHLIDNDLIKNTVKDLYPDQDISIYSIERSLKSLLSTNKQLIKG